MATTLALRNAGYVISREPSVGNPRRWAGRNPATLVASRLNKRRFGRKRVLQALNCALSPNAPGRDYSFCVSVSGDSRCPNSTCRHCSQIHTFHAGGPQATGYTLIVYGSSTLSLGLLWLVALTHARRERRYLLTASPLSNGLPLLAKSNETWS